MATAEEVKAACDDLLLLKGAQRVVGKQKILTIYSDLHAENQRLKALCLRESEVLKEALHRIHNKSMIQCVITSLAEAATGHITQQG